MKIDRRTIPKHLRGLRDDQIQIINTNEDEDR